MVRMNHADKASTLKSTFPKITGPERRMECSVPVRARILIVLLMTASVKTAATVTTPFRSGFRARMAIIEIINMEINKFIT
jgi:hypothetical protein